MSVLKTWQTLVRYPLGRWIFARALCFKAPYFATIRPRFERLEPGCCKVSIPDRRSVHNHLGTVHAIALCNLAELAGGIMTDATLPLSMRWIPKGTTVEYLKKASGRMRAVARPEMPIVESAVGYDLPVIVEAFNAADEVVFRARIAMWVSPRRKQA